jgi:hypothetical protein
MVGRARAFLDVLRSALPDLIGLLWTARLWEGAETHIEYSLYQRMPAIDLSKRVSAVATKRPLALRLGVWHGAIPKTRNVL